MKIILLSGGSGKRLWPLSNESRSKQFLKVLTNESNHLESMIQRVWRQLKSVGLHESVMIATNSSQLEMLQNQIEDDVPFIIEPESRDTFPAIALSAVYLYSSMRVSPDETVIVLPVDPYVNDNFFENLKLLASIIDDGPLADMALLGAKPTYPSEKYGYIVPGRAVHSQTSYFDVSYFREKPEASEAIFLIEKGALWNCGVFAFKLKYLLQTMQSKNYSVDYDVLKAGYNSLPKISFDYEVVERAKNVVVLPYEGMWKDLGTWNTLTEEMGSNQFGKGILSPDSKNSVIINELELPVVVLGIQNSVIVVSSDGVLIAEKTATPKIKEFLTFNDSRPMYVERRWGWYRILDIVKDEHTETITRRVCITKGKNLSLHYHRSRSEIWTILRGIGMLHLNGVTKLVSPGEVIEIKPRDKHSLKASEDLEFIEIQRGAPISNDDIYRISLEWAERN